MDHWQSRKFNLIKTWIKPNITSQRLNNHKMLLMNNLKKSYKNS